MENDALVYKTAETQDFGALIFTLYKGIIVILG